MRSILRNKERLKDKQFNRRQFNHRAIAAAAMAAVPITFVPQSHAAGCSMMICMRDDPHGRSYMRGDIINVRPGDPACGRLESYDVWVQEGLQGICEYTDVKGKRFTHNAKHQTADNWPGIIRVVYFPSLSPLTANRYALEGDKAMRVWKVDLEALEAMATSPREQHKWVIDRDAKLVHAAFSTKPGIEIKPKRVKPVITWGVVDPVIRDAVIA